MSDQEELVDPLLKEVGEKRYLFVKNLTVQLSWHAKVDLDLVAFYRTKSGKTGGVYSSMYAEGGQGNLASFPYMELDQDAGVDGSDGDSKKVETLKISKFDDIAELYLVAINFTDASRNQTSEFASFDGQVHLKNEKGEKRSPRANIFYSHQKKFEPPNVSRTASMFGMKCEPPACACG